MKSRLAEENMRNIHNFLNRSPILKITWFVITLKFNVMRARRCHLWRGHWFMFFIISSVVFLTCPLQRIQQIVSSTRTGETHPRHSSQSSRRPSRTSCWRFFRRSSIKCPPTFSWQTCQHRMSWGMLIRRWKSKKRKSELVCLLRAPFATKSSPQFRHYNDRNSQSNN